MAAPAAWADVVIFPTDLASEFPQLVALDAALVVDGYNPLLAELLPLIADRKPAARLAAWTGRMVELHQQYLIGDFFICASERQRNWWLGQLEVAGRINPETFETDPSLRSLVDVVPYGLPSAAPQRPGAVVRNVWPGIGDEAHLLLWGGGLWPWLDPVTAIEAVARVVQTHPHVKLLFPGTRHPNPAMQEIPTGYVASRARADQLGLTDKSVFFGDWVPYEQWPGLLLECDLALSLHFDSFETQLAFRGRVLDYIWSNLPMVVTTGDATSELVAQHDLGIVVNYGDAAATAAAISTLLDEQPARRRPHFAAARRTLTWERAAEPLVRFCRQPRRASDRTADRQPIAPFYRARFAALEEELDALRQENGRLTALVDGYERGRYMRMMRGLKRLRSHGQRGG